MAVSLALTVSASTIAFSVPPTAHGLPLASTTLLPSTVISGIGAATTLPAAKVNLKKITINNLNLRQGKSARTKMLLTIPKNTALTITETSGAWGKASYKGKSGWVATRYLKNAPAAQSVAYRYTTGFAPLRKSASATSASLGVYQRRAKVQYLSVAGAWTKVKVSGLTGFIQSAGLSTTNPAIKNRWLKSKQVVRKDASPTSTAISTLAKGAKVEWLRVRGSWTAVRTSQGNGWVPTATLASGTVAPHVSKPPVTKLSYRWTTATVNLRKGAGTSFASLGQVPGNQKVTYLKGSKGWSNVKTSKGSGWISNKYLDLRGQQSFAVYGTLRKGQSAYYLLKGKTTKETKTAIASHRMYLQPKQTWLSYVIPSSTKTDKVVVERMDIKPALYRSTVIDMDKWERFDPTKPLDDQNYNRVLVTDKDGKTSWAYLGSKKIGQYLTENGIRVNSGDYLKRF